MYGSLHAVVYQHARKEGRGEEGRTSGRGEEAGGRSGAEDGGGGAVTTRLRGGERRGRKK